MVVDIGVGTTKLMVANISKSKTVIKGVSHIDDMTPYIENGELANFTIFAEEIANAVKGMRSSTRRLILISSALGIKSEIAKYANAPMKAINSNYQSSVAKINKEVNTVDMQVYNTYITDQENSLYTVKVEAKTYTLESLIKALEAKGLSVANITDSVTSELNLLKLYPSTFDSQAHVRLMLGHTTRIALVIKDTPTTMDVLDVSMHNIAVGLMQQVQRSAKDMDELVRQIGLVEGSDEDEIIEHAGVESESYYEIAKEITRDLKMKVTAKIKQYTAANRIQIKKIIISGGFANLPGLVGELGLKNDLQFEIMDFTATRKVQDTIVINQTRVAGDGRTKEVGVVGPEFSAAVGATLAMSFVRPISLKPRRSIINIPETTLLNVSKFIMILMLLAALGSIYFPVSTYLQIQVLEAIGESIAEIRPTEMALNREITEKQRYLTALESLDGNLQPIVTYISEHESATLRIASADTLDRIKTGELVPTDSMNLLENSGELLSAEGDASLGDLGGGSEETVVAEDKEPIVIRGYSTSSEEVTTFHAGIENLSITSSKLKGIEMVTLPSEENIYIFEIEIIR